MLLTSILLEIDNCNSADKLTNMITVLDAIMRSEAAVREIEELCVTKCFEKVGFKFNQSMDENIEEQQIDCE